MGEEGVLEGDWKREEKLFLSFDSGGGVRDRHFRAGDEASHSSNTSPLSLSLSLPRPALVLILVSDFAPLLALSVRQLREGGLDPELDSPVVMLVVMRVVLLVL